MIRDCNIVLKYPSIKFLSKKKANIKINKFLAESRRTVTVGLHLGAGDTKIDGLKNCDLFNLNADLKLNATNLSIFEDNTVDWIESHHMIEHLSFNDTEIALNEWHRVLRNNGVLVITCPDLFQICLNFVVSSFCSIIFNNFLKQDYMVKMLVGSQEHEGMFHRNAFDSRRIYRQLNNHGFVVEFVYSPFPFRRTPSLLVIARKK